MSFGFRINKAAPAVGYVIDGEYVNPRLVRKGSQVSFDSPVINEHNYIVSIPLAAGEIIAFAATSPVIFACVRDGNAIISTGTVSITVNYWVFATTDAGSDDFGLRVWNEDAEKVFDSAWKVLRVRGAQGVGTVGYDSGRTYAVIPQEVHMTMLRQQAIQTNLPTVVTREVKGDGVSIVGPNVTVAANALVSNMAFGMFPAGSSIAGWTLSYNNALTTRYIVVDVTNY